MSPKGIATVNEVEEVKTRLDIVDVVGQYLQLQKAGRTFKALCPFHAENTPSFIVSPDRQSWHCFGACGTGGDMITFVMKKEAIEFPEALRILAERAGVQLQDRRSSQAQDGRRARLYAANNAAADWYRQNLLESSAARVARQYLERRGIDRETADRFGLGFSLDSWDGLHSRLRTLGFKDDELLGAGLLVRGESNLHDRFRGRLMFPIHDEKGRAVGFGARALDDSTPKYINTSQTSLFDKSGLLYGLHSAMIAIRSESRAIIVEGYMDVIAAHQNGFENVVASMGTALTERQVRILRRAAKEIALALDADAAGRDAAIRGHDVVRDSLKEIGAGVPVVTWRGLAGYQQATDVELKVVVLPEGRDPDDVIRRDPKHWAALVESAVPVLDFRLDALAAAHELVSPAGRSALVREFIPVLSVVTDPVVRAHYIQRLARLTGAREQELSTLLPARGERHRPAPVRSKSPVSEPAIDSKEEFLLALFLRFPQLSEDLETISEGLLWNGENRAILNAWRCVNHDAPLAEQIETLKQALPVELSAYVERLISRRIPDYDRKEAQKAFQDCLARLQRRELEAEKQATAALLAEREAEVGATSLLEATSTETIGDNELLEVASVHVQDMRTGLKLHGREVNDGTSDVGTGNDG
jgi:DNA primase